MSRARPLLSPSLANALLTLLVSLPCSLYKARLFGTARSLLAELSGDSSSSLPDGGAHSPGSVHSSPRDMLIMGESPRHDDPSSGMVKRKRTSDSESSMNNGAGGGRADEKDDKGEGQLPSPVSGTGADATKDGAGDKKDDGAKEELGDGAGRDKGRGGRSSGKGDGAGARERLELRKPEVEGSDRSERGILIEVRLHSFASFCPALAGRVTQN